MTRDQIFWAAFGAVCVALLGVHFVWGRLVLGNQIRAERNQWEEHQTLLTLLRTRARDRRIPNEESVQDWFRYKDWLAEQSDAAADFFRQRNRVLERRLAEGSRDPDPGDFKSNYNDLYRHSMDLVRRRMESGVQIAGADTLFTRYPWMATEALPNPENFRDIRKDIRVRRYFVLSLLFQHGVESISHFSVMPSEVIPVPNARESEFRAIPVRVRCTLPAEEVVKLLTSMLRVRESDADKMLVLMREVSISKSPGAGGRRSPPVTLEFLVDVVDFEPHDT